MKAIKYRLGKSGNPHAPFEVRWRENGKTFRKRFANKWEAQNFAAIENKESAFEPDMQFNSGERAFFSIAKKILAEAGEPIDSLPDILRRALAERRLGCPWEQARDAFLAECERRKLRTTTVGWYRRVVALFERAEKPADVAELTEERLQSYLVGQISAAHQKRVLSAFFAFCAMRGWVARNPITNAKLAKPLREKSAPEIITPEECAELMQSCPDEWKPALALMAFAGVRPNEIVSDDKAEVLRVENIDFKKRVVIVPANVAKTRQERRLAGLPAVLWHYISPLANAPKNTKIAAGSYTAFRRVKSKLPVPLSKDVLRHSFASYGYHYLGAERTVEILGHVGGFGVFAKHYKGLADAEAAKKYFEQK